MYLDASWERILSDIASYLCITPHACKIKLFVRARCCILTTRGCTTVSFRFQHDKFVVLVTLNAEFDWL